MSFWATLGQFVCDMFEVFFNVFFAATFFDVLRQLLASMLGSLGELLGYLGQPNLAIVRRELPPGAKWRHISVQMDPKRGQHRPKMDPQGAQTEAKNGADMTPKWISKVFKRWQKRLLQGSPTGINMEKACCCYHAPDSLSC